MADGVEEASILRDHSGRVGQLDANGLNGAMATTSATVKVASQRVDGSASPEPAIYDPRALYIIVWHFGLTRPRSPKKRALNSPGW